MKDYRQLVADVAAATEIASPTSYRWFGTLYAPIPAESEARMSPEDSRRMLHFALKSRLYADFYCPGAARPALDSSTYLPRANGTSSFLGALSQANQGCGSQEGGWQVMEEDEDCLIVERQGLRVWAQPREVRVQEGRATVTMPNELFRLSPGFYMALSDVEFSETDPSQQVRYYFNLQPDAAAPLVRSLTATLNRERLGFRLKVVSDANGYVRSDAGVLYAHRRDLETLWPQVEASYEAIRRSLKPATPAFVRELAPGLGFAENPPDPAESFGTARCALLAEALLRTHERSAVSVDDRLAIVEDCFAQAGLQLDTPYLNARVDL